jgi:hypothetical protein
MSPFSIRISRPFCGLPSFQSVALVTASGERSQGAAGVSATARDAPAATTKSHAMRTKVALDLMTRVWFAAYPRWPRV